MPELPPSPVAAAETASSAADSAEQGQHENSKTSTLEPDADPPAVRSFAATGLLVLASLYTLHFARDILMPITVAVILFLILWPLVRVLSRFRIPPAVGAGLVVLTVLGSFAIGIYFLWEPATRWFATLPAVIEEIQFKMQDPFDQLREATEQVEEAIIPGKSEEPQQEQTIQEDEAEPEQQPLTIRLFDVLGPVLIVIIDTGWTFIIVVVLLYFLLAAGDGYHERVVKIFPTLSDKKRAVTVIRRVHHDVAIYLLNVTMINVGLGVAIGLAMYVAGLPNSMLWGALAALLNFIPYFGPLVGQAVVGLVGLTVFENPLDAFLPVGLYFVINFCEGYLVTPTILGRRLTMNPMMVFLAVLVWGWLWGIPGALLAVPLLACFNVICDSSERLQPLSEFLGR